MKYGILFCTITLILSCGSKKNATNKVEVQTQETVSVANETTNQNTDPIKIDSTTKQSEVIKEENQVKDPNPIIDEKPINIHEDWNTLLQKYVSENGNVDYEGFKNEHEKLLSYFKALNQTLSKETDSKAHTLAFWINTYNAFTIDLVLRHYPIKSIKDIKNPWDQRYWKLGEKWYNLNDIEHNILRKMNEPRIHFAIVCASISCPKLQNEAFTASHLELQLTTATKDFLSDDTRNSISASHLELSKIFQWFSKDFKQNRSLINFLNQYTDIEISAKAKKSYKDYNWNLNE